MGGPNLDALVAILVLSLTVFAAVGIGVMVASWAVQGILFTFGHRQERESAPVLVPSETHGD
jgi:hypothetical protein